MWAQAYGYKRWADERTVAAVRQIDTAEHPEAVGFARQQLNHMVIVEELFRSRLLNEKPPHDTTNTDAIPELESLSHRLARSNEWYASYIERPSADTSERIVFVFADGQRGAMSAEEMLFHVLNHGTYHRGNIARALDLAGVPHPVDGYAHHIHTLEPERRAT